MSENRTTSIMLFVLGLFLIAVGIGLSTATQTVTRYRNVNGFIVPYQATIQPFVEVGVFMVPIGLIVLVVAFIISRVTTQPATPPTQVKRAKAEFAISLGAGILSFLLGLSSWTYALAVHPSRGWWSLSLYEPAAPPWFAGANLGTLGAIETICGIIVIIGAILIYAPGKEKIGGILVIAFSVISFPSLTISPISSIIGIIGGAFSLTRVHES